MLFLLSSFRHLSSSSSTLQPYPLTSHPSFPLLLSSSSIPLLAHSPSFLSLRQTTHTLSLPYSLPYLTLHQQKQKAAMADSNQRPCKVSYNGSLRRFLIARPAIWQDFENKVLHIHPFERVMLVRGRISLFPLFSTPVCLLWTNSPAQQHILAERTYDMVLYVTVVVRMSWRFFLEYMRIPITACKLRTKKAHSLPVLCLFPLLLRQLAVFCVTTG